MALEPDPELEGEQLPPERSGVGDTAEEEMKYAEFFDADGQPVRLDYEDLDPAWVAYMMDEDAELEVEEL